MQGQAGARLPLVYRMTPTGMPCVMRTDTGVFPPRCLTACGFFFARVTLASCCVVLAVVKRRATRSRFIHCRTRKVSHEP